MMIYGGANEKTFFVDLQLQNGEKYRLLVFVFFVRHIYIIGHYDINFFQVWNFWLEMKHFNMKFDFM